MRKLMKFNIYKNWHIFAYLFGPFLLTLGVITLNIEATTLAKLQETSGKVLSAEVSVNTGKKTTYSPLIRYSYEIKGKKFENNRIGRARFRHSTRESAAEVLAKYPVGKPVPVFYQPEDPQTAYLDTQDVGNGEILISLSILEMIFFTPVIWLIRKQSSKKERET
jgi:hypothetical protein